MRLALKSNMALVVIVLSVCVTSTAPPPALPKPAEDATLAAAMTYVAEDLSHQLAPSGVRRLLIDPLLERSSGQQTGPP